MDEIEKGQVSRSAADVYEEFFVPALFGEWASRVVDAAGIKTGERVLDVACGTGVLSRAVLDRVGPDGSVVGLDPNQGMLAVAHRKANQIEWHEGVAESLPFEDSRFDAVVSQFGLMFFEDRKKALREMTRVLRPAGRYAVAVWGALEETPGYAEMTKLLDRLFGERAAGELQAPFSLGDTATLRSIFTEAGLAGAQVDTIVGKARFPSIRSWVYTDIKGWTLADMIDDDQFEALAKEAEEALQQFVTPSGSVEFRSPAHIVSGRKG